MEPVALRLREIFGEENVFYDAWSIKPGDGIVFKATKGSCGIVPVRVGDVQTPPVLLQNLYIDLYANGIEAAIHQIVNVVQGQSTFTPQHLGFSS